MSTGPVSDLDFAYSNWWNGLSFAAGGIAAFAVGFVITKAARFCLSKMNECFLRKPEWNKHRIVSMIAGSLGMGAGVAAGYIVTIQAIGLFASSLFIKLLYTGIYCTLGSVSGATVALC